MLEEEEPAEFKDKAADRRSHLDYNARAEDDEVTPEYSKKDGPPRQLSHRAGGSTATLLPRSTGGLSSYREQLSQREVDGAPSASQRTLKSQRSARFAATLET